ncbi:MAG: stage II sporulation protein M [Calditrichaceae bacterium]
MQEVLFLKQNMEKWKQFEAVIQSNKRVNPDQLASLFIELTDDLSYARTFFPSSKTTRYLNTLTGLVHQKIYKNEKQKSNSLIQFWKQELPLILYESRKEILISLLIFMTAVSIGIISAANDHTFNRLILGDTYINKTLENINKGDPMAVYKQANEVEMFLGITLNNIWVSFQTFILGIFFSIGTVFSLFNNGVMLGSFQYFFFEQGLLFKSMLVIWIHGTLEISAIIIAGAAGLVMGNSILFPKTFSRLISFRRGAGRGMKIAFGLIPVFIMAGFLEGFITRHTTMPVWLSLSIIFSSLTLVIWYFIIYPSKIVKDNMNENF